MSQLTVQQSYLFVLGVVTRQKLQSMGLWYWELMSRPDPAVLPVGTLHFLVGRLICPGGHVSSLSKSNPIHFLEWFWVSRRIFIHSHHNTFVFLAATKQLYKWYFPSVRLSVCPSVCPSHLFDYVPIIVSSWHFQELLPMTDVRSMQKVKVRGQRSRSQRSRPHLAVSGL